MSSNMDRLTVEAIEKHAIPLGGALADYDPIIKAAKGKQFILIGEASHGTMDFYRMRAEITMRLISESGFNAVATEADWPDAYAVNRYVCGRGEDMTPEHALSHFERFPTWMWGNHEILHFIRWLAAYNKSMAHPIPVGFYGLDLYSMSSSVRAVIDYLDRIDPKAAQRARQRYACLDEFLDRPQEYGQAAEFGLTRSCEHDITAQLIDLRHKAFHYLARDGFIAGDEYFCAEQNARLVRNAEVYYRAMFRGRPNSWNLRDQHMFETLGDLTAHLSRQLNRNARIIVWAHNSHIGNAAATDMSRRGEFNIGQLVRESHNEKALLIGFSTSRGSVTAASEWDAPAERKRVRPPLPGSYEALFHQVHSKQFLLDLRANNRATDLLLDPKLERAIGVIYRPETERGSHYFRACLPEQFDFIIHLDETEALEPLNIPQHWHRGEMDDTYPTGL